MRTPALTERLRII